MGFLPEHLAQRADGIIAGTICHDTDAPLRGEELWTGEAADYPRTWADFVGQERAKQQLQVNIASAKRRNARLDHTILAAGSGGIGKTTLAYLIAAGMGVGLLPTTAPITPEEFRNLVMGMEDGDIIFLDEVHLATAGNQSRADWLLKWMLGGGLKTARGTEKTPDVTLVAATTELGKLPATILRRFVNQPHLSDYRLDEAAHIAGKLAERMDVELAEDWWSPVAEAATRNPGAMRRILSQIRDLHEVMPQTHPNLDLAFEYAGLSADGLTVLARHILVLLATKQNRTASIETIGKELDEPGTLRHHERPLLQRGLVEIVGQGRKLTEAGFRRALQEIQPDED